MARRPRHAWLVVAGLLLSAAGAAADTTEVRFGLTPEFIGGRGGGDLRGDGNAVPFHATLASGPVALTLRIPDLAAAGRSAMPMAFQGDAATGDLGDLRLTGRLTLAEGEPGEAPWLELALQTRLPTATDPSLGTGQWEHVLRLETGMELAGGATLDLSLGRRLAPFARRGRGGQDYWIAEGSLGLPIAESWRAGLAAYAQDRQPDVATQLLELGAFVEREVAEDLTIGLFTWHGLTRESAAFTIGLRLAYRLRWAPPRLGG